MAKDKLVSPKTVSSLWSVVRGKPFRWYRGKSDMLLTTDD